MSWRAPAASGRKLVTETENRNWTMRIRKEEEVNAKVNPEGFQMHSAVRVADVPVDFKVGLGRPEWGASPGFNPNDRGWDEFRRCMNEKAACPRDRNAYPQTYAQDTGWLLAQSRGEEHRASEAKRLQQQPVRIGHGWLEDPVLLWASGRRREEYTEAAAPAVSSTALALGELPDVEAQTVVSAAPPSWLSAAAPAGSAASACAPLRSSLSASPPARGSGVSASPPMSRDAGSALSRTAPAGQWRGGAPLAEPPAPSAATQLSAASSLPALRAGGDAEALLRRREAKLSQIMEKSRRFLKNGERGDVWFRGRPRTDATYFQNHFAKINGNLLPHKVPNQIPKRS